MRCPQDAHAPRRKSREGSEEREDCFAGTPDSSVLRMLPSYAAEDDDNKLVLADASSAYYQAPVKNPDGTNPVMRPPLDFAPKT